MFKRFLFLLQFLIASGANASDLIEVRLKGMTGEGSQIIIRQELEKLPQTEMAEVDALTGRAFVAVKNGQTLSDDTVKKAIEALGFRVTDITRSGTKQQNSK